ncbi:Dolichyldiphosphatase [Sparassis crispa]|uniref:Dolichyldiphosphatase n=1 Tax=Sparassis crispa TaxID=139825 RepID=A0A401H542_9APHY|nr:Dolichyldiphosphatase [Sparassis crispa]GBE89565.1 Dolichyldiphosphatase [Sparassis crispa]
MWTREILFIEMYAGQLLCEVSNWFLKHAVRQERPVDELGAGYGFPSSHSQWMGYFTAFLYCHFSFRHRFISTGYLALDLIRVVVLYFSLAIWAGGVAYSRFYLSYHTIPQVLWGLGLGALFGTCYYTLVELLPSRYPHSVLGKMKAAVIANPASTWFRMRDSWAVWADGGVEAQWLRWRTEWCRIRAEVRGEKKRT